ncbi:MAG: twin-arginine translocation signal domain-containing protein, partial [Prevotella sp.]|nr:twin-arginine translocation signal domain-containing protein [Prevotella sp.]
MKKNITRRSFLKLLGAGTVATAATLSGCNKANKAEEQAANEYKDQVEPPVGKMTYRENPTTKDKVSL